jgi:[glutamine synthetase] adenylyltransferase / [glutamine synthetase]-adenylyl-L-tyrosine phosphorylase
MAHLLEEIRFRDRARALGEIKQVQQGIPPEVHDRIKFLLATSADPDGALHYLCRLYQTHPVPFSRLVSHSDALQILVAVFAHSHFLSEEVLQHPDWVEELAAAPNLSRVLTCEDYVDRLQAFLGPDSGVPQPVQLAQYRRKELLRILARDVLGDGEISEITEEISNLADAVLHFTYSRIRADLISRYGTPRYRAMDGELVECGMSVIALGKLGGRELNYSSDIDLMFLYSGNGYTDGDNPITNKEFYKKVCNQYTDLLSTYTAEGLCYRVDLRLRPDGRLGEVCLSLDGAMTYYEKRARDWELQMLIKARVAAGEQEPGRALLDFVEPMIYRTTLDFSAVESVSLTRERIHEKHAARRLAGVLDVKLARGGIRDIEFLVQCLQRLHGGREPWLRHAGSLLALSRLHDKSFLSDSEYGRLASSYTFLRHLEHRLQFADDRQTHVLPSSLDDLELLARRMPATEIGRQASADKLLHQLNVHLEEVQETYDRVIHSQQPLYYSSVPQASLDVRMPMPPAQVLAEPLSSNLIRSLDQRAPGLAASLAKCPVRRSTRSFEHFLERVVADPRLLSLLDSQPQLVKDVVDIFENSPHFSEELVRRPELVEELAGLHELQGEHLDYGKLVAPIADLRDLRQIFRRQTLRIQAESIVGCQGIFETLAKQSDLADAVIAKGYQMAVQQIAHSHPPIGADYRPVSQMMVIAMGRLGMREFDLGSDADLNFVLPDEDVGEMRFWTRVAERLIDILSAYTGDGNFFAVDTRLRPNGREGPLVQTASAYKDYISNRAEAWEGITYMKSRAVVGDAEKATRFLHELQDSDWRRYGQSGRSREELRAMRSRLEREQGAQNPLKAGPGGYYDIDFALMYLRLKGAGIFFKVLNTPERIDIIEKMGHLERQDAEFLMDAASFYRAIDHALRVYSGHAEGKLPNSDLHLEVITTLVYRWTPEKLHSEPLPIQLAQIQEETRNFFKRLFG